MPEHSSHEPFLAGRSAGRWSKRFLVLGIWASALSLAILWFRTSPDVESGLIRVFGRGRHGDAFDSVNGIYHFFIMMVLSWVALFVFLYIERKRNALIVLCIGPVLGLLLVAVMTDWTDPAWMTNLAVLTISLMVGCGFTVMYAVVRP
ncbi:MAG: hypothetical protein WD648_06405 [Planctomycetaceae bacterium]